MRDTKRPKIKRGKEEYTYQTSGNDLQTLEGKSQQYKAIVNAIEQGQSKDDIRNNLNTLLYQEMQEKPEETSSVTSTGTEQTTPRAERKEGGNVIDKETFNTLQDKKDLTESEWDQIIDYANTNKKNYLLLSSETIYPCNKLNNKNTNISFRADQYTLNNDNIVNIADITGELQFIDLTIDSDISSLQCNKLNIIDNLSISDINDLNKFTKRLQIGNCDLNSLPNISNLKCSELILGVPKNFDINKISPQTLQYLSQYQGNLVVYTIKDGKSIDLTEEIKTKIQALQTH